MDLFTPIVGHDEMYPHFKTVYSSPYYAPNRAVVSQWADGFVDRDNKFVKEFQTTFNSSFWELYLHGLFKSYGFSIDMSHSSPDFIINNGKQELVIEAVVASNAHDSPPEYATAPADIDFLMKTGKDFTDFNMQSIIRLCNSITSKRKRYKERYSSLSHVQRKPFVIAVAPFHCPLHYLTADVPIRALLYDYYVDEKAMNDNPELYPDKRPPTRHLGRVCKDNGTEIELGFFNDNCMPEISAVIFSHLATWGKTDALCDKIDEVEMLFATLRTENFNMIPNITTKATYRESIFDGLQIYHNPYALYPINEDFFRRKEVAQCFDFNESTDTLIYDVDNNYNDGFLAFRSINRIAANGDGH